MESLHICVLIGYYEPQRMRFLNGPLSDPQYIPILDEVVMPILCRDKNLVLMQVRNQNYIRFLFILIKITIHSESIKPVPRLVQQTSRRKAIKLATK